MHFSLFFIQRIYKIGFLLVAILLLADLITFFYYPNTALGDIFLATREQTPLTWLSALAMFFIALSCFSVYLERKKKIWYFLAVIFFFFSLDDAVYLHERLSGFFQDSTVILSSFPTYIWVVLYFPLLIFALGALVRLVWRDASDENKKPIIIALLILGIAIFLDLTDGFMQKNPSIVFCLNDSCHLSILHLFRLTEEVLEVFALGILGYTSIKEHCLIKNGH